MRHVRMLGALAAMATLAACGTTADAPSDEADPSAEGSGSGESITLTDDSGDEVVLDGPAQKVVALEWGQAEILSSLEVELVGISDREGYASWVGNAVPLLGEPTDVGTRTEPSVEAIAGLEPDLIVGATRSVPDEVLSQMNEIAPVVLFDNANAADPLGTIENSVTLMADAVGKAEQGEALMEEFESTLAQNATEVEDAGLSDTPVVFTSPYADGNSVQVRMHGQGSAPQAVLSEVGLDAAWTETGDEANDLTYTDVEGLTALPDETWFLYWANADSEDPLSTHLESNSIWSTLPFVEDGRVGGVADGIWVYGGPESLAAFATDVVTVISAG